MDETPKTLEEALIQIDGWRAAYRAKLDEIVELNNEIKRLEADRAQDAGREEP